MRSEFASNTEIAKIFALSDPEQRTKFCREVKNASAHLLDSLYAITKAPRMAIYVQLGSTPPRCIAARGRAKKALFDLPLERRAHSKGILSARSKMPKNSGKYDKLVVFCAFFETSLSKTPQLSPVLKLFVDQLASLCAWRQAYVAGGRDPLTHLRNIRDLDADIDQQIRNAQRRDEWLGLLFLDVDHLRKINRQFGHRVGSLVLRNIAETVTKQSEGRSSIYRYGGDEFILLERSKSRESLVRSAEAMCKAIEETPMQHIQKHKRLGVTASIGLSLARGKVLTTSPKKLGEKLLDTAERALFDAKEKGRNRVSVKKVV